MRIILAAVLALTALWSGYWFVGSRSVESGIRGWLDLRAEAGWVANYAAVSTGGYPNRFDTTITEPELADPATGLAWSAPFLQLFRLSYTPNHIIAVWPETQTFATPNQRVTVSSASARASFVFVSGQDYQLDRSSFVTDAVSVRSTSGWSVDLATALLASRPGPQPHVVEIGAEAAELRVGGTVLDRFAAAGLTPGNVDHMKLDALIGFDAPWDRQALEERRPAITSLDLKLLQINWGQLEFWAAGDLTVDAEGLPTGKITIRAQNWREMLKLAVAVGWVPSGMAGPIETGLGFLASVSGTAESLDAPLKFENGKIAFGPITLGEAPRLILR